MANYNNKKHRQGARLLQQTDIEPEVDLESVYRGLVSTYQIEVRHTHENGENLDQLAVGGPQDIYNLLKHSETLDREIFYCLHLSTRNKILSLEEISKGSLNASLVHPREVYKAAILRSAASIIVAHNHPSGDPTPSKDDIDITKRLSDAGEILGISVLDHVIIGRGYYCSLRERGDF